jgi:transposase-like protein
LDASLAQFAGRPLAEAFPYLILDARYERVREAGVIASQAVLIAIGIDWDGRRQSLPRRKAGMLAVGLAKWSGKYSKLTGWVEENIDETLTPSSRGQAVLPADAAAP